MSLIDQAIDYALTNPESTPLCDIFTAEGSDKARPGKHSYAALYRVLLAKFMAKPDLRLFELGIGTNNPYLPSSMGVNDVPGASLRAWKKWFPQADIIGADIDRDILFQENRITTHHVDQTDGHSIQQMWEQVGEPVDIIIDDGLHTFYANKTFLCGSKHMLKPGGLYIVEDVCEDDVARFKELELDGKELGFDFDYARMLRMPIPGNDYDNNVFILQKS